MKKIKLQTRFFLTYILLALTIVVLFSLFFFQYTSNILIERELQNIINLSSNFQTQTDEAIRVLDTVSINIGYSSLIKEKLEQYFEQDRINWSNTNTLAELFVAINGTNSQVEQMNIYDLQGNIIGFGRSKIMTDVDLEKTHWYEPTMNLNGHKYVSLPYKTSSLSKNTNVETSYISLYRGYFNKYRKQVGFIETIQASKTVFKNIITYGKKNPSGPVVYVFSRDGTLIFPYETEEKPAPSLYTWYYDSLVEGSNHITLTNPTTQVRELMAWQESEYTDWIYVTIMPEQTILKPVRILTNLLILIVVLLLMVSVGLSYYMSKSLTKPIKQLRNRIYKTELATLGNQPGSSLGTSIDELEELNEAFHRMSINLKDSMNELINTRQQELKSRNMALQSQINPHFYYNSLSSIIVLAENEQCDDVVTLCRNLSSIMRYITKGSQSIVTVQEEIDYIHKYLYCMKIRYQTSLNYSINIDPSILNEKIPKLIIQPIVENAIKYGTNCEPPWNIAIHSTVDESSWTIHVIDSGAGFSEESINVLNQRIQNFSNGVDIADIEIDGMGLINVYSRWKIYCEDNFIFTYGNRKEGGGIVSIGKFINRQGDLYE